MTTKERAIELCDGLHGIKNSDALRDNVKLICSTVVEALESVTSPRRVGKLAAKNKLK